MNNDFFIDPKTVAVVIEELRVPEALERKTDCGYSRNTVRR